MRFLKIKKACFVRGARLSLVLLTLNSTIFLSSTAKALVPAPNYAVLLGLSTAAVLGARSLDTSAQSYFGKQGRIGNLNWLGNKVIGSGVPGLILGSSFWVGGLLAGGAYEVHSGRAQVEALITTGILVTLLKSVSDRRRPNGEDSYSFPSAHTAYAFTTAAVLNEFYGWKIGVPAYLLGALTAASRMQDNQHWFSDTVGGAAIAIFIGTAFSRWHLRAHEQGDDGKNWIPKVSPAVSQEGMGVSLNWSF